MNLSDPDDLRCTLSCAISVPQSLCPTAGKRHPCQCPEHHGECLLHISLFRHGIQLREDTVEGIQRRGSNVTKHHTWRRHSGPLQVLLVSNVSKAAGTTQLWSNSWRFVLQNASECFSFTHQTRITCCSQHQRQECSMVRPRAAVMQRSGADMNCIIRRHGEDNVQLNRADWSWRLLWGQVPRD